jgi:hypothetical protein
MDVLFFCPTAAKPDAGQLLNILRDVSSQTGQLNVDVFDENSPTISVENKNYQAVVIVYTPGLELSGSLFGIVQYIEGKNPPGRFIFLPETGGGKQIPPIFHVIRYRQHNLYYYPASGHSPNLLETQLDPFKAAWHEFTAPFPQDKPGGGKGRRRSVPLWLILILSIIILTLIGLIYLNFPRFLDILPVPSPTSTPIRPPAATAFWLQESFQQINTSKHWQVQHYYYGRQTIQTNLPGAGLRLYAYPVVTDAVFQLDSLQSWPMDELQSLSFSFLLSGMSDPGAESSLVFSLYLSENSAYRLECVIIPAEAQGKIQCQVRSPAQTAPLSETAPLSLNTRHTASLVFDPHTYSLQFFLDDTYYGQRDIQAVEHWRSRNFKLQVMTRVKNMSTGTFSCELGALSLAHQP